MPLHRAFPLILVAGLCVALTGVADTAPSGPEAPSLVTDGDPERGIEPCANCHQADGGGSEGGRRTRALLPWAVGYLSPTKSTSFATATAATPSWRPGRNCSPRMRSGRGGDVFPALPPASNAIVPDHMEIRKPANGLRSMATGPNADCPPASSATAPSASVRARTSRRWPGSPTTTSSASSRPGAPASARAITTA